MGDADAEADGGRESLEGTGPDYPGTTEGGRRSDMIEAGRGDEGEGFGIMPK